MTCLDFEIYDYDEYIAVLSKYSCYNNFYDNKQSQIGNKFMNDLLKLSKNRCFMCGYSLETNNEIGLYVEREHLINKVQETTKNIALNKCRKNIVPICRTCNGKKTQVNISQTLKDELEELERHCDYKGNSKCNFDTCLPLFKNENFDFNLSSKNYKLSCNRIFFDFITKVYFGNMDYINEFDLNYRTNIIFNDIFKILYNCTFSNYPNLKNHIQMFSKSILDDNLIEWLDSFNILNDTNKRDDLIETIVLLELL